MCIMRPEVFAVVREELPAAVVIAGVGNEPGWRHQARVARVLELLPRSALIVPCPPALPLHDC